MILTICRDADAPESMTGSIVVDGVTFAYSSTPEPVTLPPGVWRAMVPVDGAEDLPQLIRDIAANCGVLAPTP